MGTLYVLKGVTLKRSLTIQPKPYLGRVQREK